MYQATLMIDGSPRLMEQGGLPHVAAARLRAAIAKDPTDVLNAIGGAQSSNQPFEEALNGLGRSPSRTNSNSAVKFVTDFEVEANGHKMRVSTRRVEQLIYDHKKEIKLT